MPLQIVQNIHTILGEVYMNITEESIVYATTIKERVHVLKDTIETNESLSNLDKWRKRRSLLDEASFSKMLSDEELTAADFNLGIKQLCTSEREKLLFFLQNQSWYKHFIIMKEVYYVENIDDVDYSIIFKVFIQYIRDKFRRASEKFQIHITKEALSSILESFFKQLLSISEKTVAYDLHRYKETIGLKKESSKQRFQEYLEQNFCNKEKYWSFFYKYPVLLRLITERTIFFQNNIEEFLSRVSENRAAIVHTFGTNKELNITDIQLGNGDSHDSGRSVALFTLGTTKIVYKPKNLQLAHPFDTLLTMFNKGGFDFHTPKRLIREHYAFEQFIEYESCTEEHEIRSFYKNYGNIIGLIYMINGNDLHFENIIAKGRYPTIVDIETIIQNCPPIFMGEGAMVQAKNKLLDSILISGLLTMSLYKDRSQDGKSSVDLSALNGGGQKIPFKVLKAQNYGTDEMKFDYDDHHIAYSSNIPKLNNERVNYENYKDEIIVGLKEFLHYILEHKSFVIDQLSALFGRIIVRNVVRSTQRYVDLLSFSYHPSCMVDMIEREKVLENLWAYPFLKKECAKYEKQDMMVGDVPQFFNDIHSTNLITTNKEQIQDVYPTSSFKRMIEKIEELDEENIETQLMLLKIKLDKYDKFEWRNTIVAETSNEKSFEVNYETEIIDIANTLIHKAVQCEQTNTVTWLDIQDKGNWELETLNNNLYDALPGVFLFFSAFCKAFSQEKYIAFKRKIKNTMLLLPVNDKVVSSFEGRGSLLYPLMVDYILHDEESSLEIAKQIADVIIASKAQIHTAEWIGGSASLIVNFINLYELTTEQKYKQFAMKLGKELNEKSSTSFTGFAHGFSGVYYALDRLNQYSKGYFTNKIKQLISLEDEDFDTSVGCWIDKRENKTLDKWCHGVTGIALARLNVTTVPQHLRELEEIVMTHKQTKVDDSLCHGNMGTIEVLYQLYIKTREDHLLRTMEHELREIIVKKQKYRRFSVQGTYTFPCIGLFTGLSGIGFQLLRYLYPESIPNVLLFELPARNEKR